MSEEIRQICRQLLEDNVVQVVIGYGQAAEGITPHPTFVTDSAQVDQLVWNNACHHNLVTYLQRAGSADDRQGGSRCQSVRRASVGDPGARVAAHRSQLFVVGVACDRKPVDSTAQCGECDSPVPKAADVVIGADNEAGDQNNPRYAELERFMEKAPQQRFQYWLSELQRCTRCYACRQVCPLCYCRQCIVDKNRPVCVEPSATLQGNFSWHITRAFHLAGRCIGCDQCTRSCPTGIDLRLLNLALARATEDSFSYRAGYDTEAEPVIGAFREADSEEFIR